MAQIDESLESPCAACGGTLFEIMAVPDVGTGEMLGDIRRCIACGYEHYERWWNGEDADHG